VQLLIIGGLLAIGLIALIALFFVVRSAPRTNGTAATAASHNEKNTSPTQAQLGAEQTQPVTQHMPIPVYDEEKKLKRQVRTLPIMNGQLHELSVELHDLYQQAQDIEHRLLILTEMMGNIERSQAGRPSIEEEV